MGNKFAAVPGLISNLTDGWSHEENPHGNWAFGYKYDPDDFTNPHGAFTVYPNKRTTPGQLGWCGIEGTDLTSQGTIFKNDPSPAWYGDAYDVIMHPGGANVGGTMVFQFLGQWATVRWTAPTSKTVRVIGSFGSGDWGAIDSRIIKNNSETLLQHYDAIQGTGIVFDFEVVVSAGDTLDFQVGIGYYCGSTPLKLIIDKESLNLGGPVKLVRVRKLLVPGQIGLQKSGRFMYPWMLGAREMNTASTVCILGGKPFTKTYAERCYAAYGYISTGYTGPILVGETADSVKYTTMGNTFSPLGTLVYGGKTYYYSSDQYWMGGNLMDSSDTGRYKLPDSANIAALALALLELGGGSGQMQLLGVNV